MVQMIPDPNGRVRSREVGCQWESPEPEERRDVGCQSYLTTSRDAGIQTDLSWRPSGVCTVPWECVFVRKDEPGGSSLLHHGNYSGLPFCSLQWVLPTVFPVQPPSPPHQNQIESKDLHPTTSLSSMPPAQKAPLPPGVIAPLSPHLAEEGCNKSNCFAPQKKRQSERSEFSREKPRGLTLTSHGVQRAQKRKRTWEQEQEQEQEREQREEVCGLNFTSGEDLHVHLSIHGNEGSRHGNSKGAENTQSPGRKPAGPLIRSPLESEEQLHDLAAADQDRGRKLHRESGDKGGASGDTAEISSERQTDHMVSDRHLVSDELVEGQQRPKRKMVGPPVRYLVESEKQLRGPTAANRDWGKKPQKKSADRVLSSKVGTDPDKAIGHVVSSGLASHMMSDGDVVSNGHLVSDGLTTHVMSDGDVGHVILDRLTSHEMSDGHMVSDEHTGCTLLSGHGVLDGQMGHMVSDKWQRPRRKMVGPPIRYLLESEELSYDPPTVNKNCRRKLQKGTSRSEVSSVRATTDLDKQSHVVLDGLTGHIDSYDQLGHVASDQHRVSDVNIVLDGQMGHVASNEHRRPRRKTVGPPIRYLLESEEQSHGPAAANQDKWRGFKQGGKPQDNADLARDLSDTTMIDLEKKTGHKMSDIHMDSVRRMMVGPPTRYLIESEEQSHGLVAASRNCGRKPQKSSRYLSSSSGDREKQMGHIASDNLLGHLRAYLVYRDLQSNQVTIIPPCFVRLQHLL